jgi:hypothetical protein
MRTEVLATNRADQQIKRLTGETPVDHMDEATVLR